MDWSGLNNVIATTFCDTLAIWSHANVTNNVLLAIDNQHGLQGDQDYQVANAEVIVAGCPANLIIGMARKDTLSFNNQTHVVLQVIPDASNWATIIMEKS